MTRERNPREAWGPEGLFMFLVGVPERILLTTVYHLTHSPLRPIEMGDCQIGTRPPVGGDGAGEWEDANTASGPIDRALALDSCFSF